ncbi:TPA: hypothetical protein UOJ25_000408 [Stenotrophomonas maltophilia]|nr:hypothetical protein [Stenotrophomonas maltophilia]
MSISNGLSLPTIPVAAKLAKAVAHAAGSFHRIADFGDFVGIEDLLQSLGLLRVVAADRSDRAPRTKRNVVGASRLGGSLGRTKGILHDHALVLIPDLWLVLLHEVTHLGEL